MKKEQIQHQIAFNGFRGGNKGSVGCQPLSEYDKTIRLPWLHEMVLQIRGEKSIRSVDNADETALAKAQQRVKGQLPFRCAHYYRFLKNRRAQDNADPTAFLFQTTVDVDDKDVVAAALERARELNCGDSIWRGALLHLEYSARKKLHIDIRMPIGMTIEETQRAYCEALGVPYDESCVSPERMIFITDQDSEIYRSKDWYRVLDAEEIKLRREAFVQRGLTIDGRKVPGVNIAPVKSLNSPNPSYERHTVSYERHDSVDEKGDFIGDSGAISEGNPVKTAASGTQPVKSLNSPNPSYERHAVSYERHDFGKKSTSLSPASEKTLIAFELFREAAGLKGMEIDTVGSRHSSLLAILSAGASRVMSEEELMKVVAEKMPSYYQEPDCHQLIHDFYAKYGDSSKPFSRDVIRINATAEKQAMEVKSEEGRVMNSIAGGNHEVQSSQFPVQSSESAYPDPPKMPEKLPRLVELLVSKTPDIYKPAVACAIFPPLATHLWRARFKYIDNVKHEATLMCCLFASTGAGKSSVQKPISMIMEDIRKRDQENLQREKEWKDEMMRKGANKDKRKRPANLIIQEIDADMTNPAFVMRTAEAQEHFLYTSLNEIDQFDALKGTGNQQFRIMCLAADPCNIYGQTRVGAQSVTERVTIRFNWNASSTIQKGIRYFKNVLTDGPISRINFCTIPEREIGDDIPRFGEYDDEFREQLKPYIENLCKISGDIDCREAFELAEKLKDENADFARLSQDRVYENLSFRANVIAYLKACVLYVANGCKWEPEIEEFIRWSERYDLYCKMRFFGDAIKRAERDGVKESKRGPASILGLLPEEFSYRQVESLRQDYEMSSRGTAKMLRNWVHRGYIRVRETDSVTQKLSDSVFIKVHG